MTGSRTRVAYILTPITFGGAEKVSLNFLRTADRDSFEIHPILLVRPWEEETYFGRELKHLGYTYETVPVALNAESDNLRVLRVVYRLYSLLKKGSYDLVHTHGYFADICGLSASFILGIRGISTCHGFINNDFKLRIYNSLDRYALRLCRKVIAVSEEIKTELVRSGLRDSKIIVIPNAVSSPIAEDKFCSRRKQRRFLLHVAANEHVIGYLGRLSSEKGLAHLVEAFEEIIRTRMGVKLVIVGDGPERGALEQRVRAKRIVDKVVFAGFQTEPEDWYPAFDTFVLPSLTEGTPLALLEAMAAGVPVIASAVGGVPKIVTDGVNGMLVEPGDPSAITEKLRIVLENSELAWRIGRAGMETVKTEYSISGWCQRIDECYTGVCRVKTIRGLVS